MVGLDLSLILDVQHIALEAIQYEQSCREARNDSAVLAFDVVQEVAAGIRSRPGSSYVSGEKECGSARPGKHTAIQDKQGYSLSHFVFLRRHSMHAGLRAGRLPLDTAVMAWLAAAAGAES